MKYKLVTKIVHKLIIFLKLDGIIARIAGNNRLLRKLIPGNTLYSSRTRRIRRDKTNFDLDLSDYMQWHIFSGVKEIAWQKAKETISHDSEAVIIDIGCNVGAFTIKVACNTLENEKVKFIAFDPNPFIGEKFLKNLELNKAISAKVSFQLVAIGNENNLTSFSFDMSNTGAGKIGGAKHNTFQTKVLTLDNFVSQNKINNICFIKIDVEGFEPYVFEGAKNTIMNQKPRLYFEITESWHKNYGRSASEIFDFLLSIGYTVYVGKNDKLFKVTDYRKEIASAFQNNFFAECK